MVPDPYKALNLPHSATKDQIKRSYRELARRYHPDRQLQQSEEQQEQSKSKFAEIAAAYALLNDDKCKQHYDHIYRYGGYDDDEEEPIRRFSPEESKVTDRSSSRNRKRKSMGVGYTCTDPFAFVWSQGRVHSTTTIAGIQIPTRLQMAQPGSLRFAYSSGQFMAGPAGTRKCISRTTQFADGKKYTKTETTIVHPDGRAQVLDGEVHDSQRAFAMDSSSNVTEHQDAPWYIHAWTGIKDKLAMCYNPCAAVAAQ